MGIPVFVDFGPHRVRHVGTHGDHVFVALEHYPLVMELDAEGVVVRKVPIPYVTHVVNGTTILAFTGPLDGGANRQTPKDFVRPERVAFDFSGARVPVPTGVPAEALRTEGIALPDLSEESLDDFMKRVNLRLEEAGATRRVFAVDTKGDDDLYVICTPSAAGDARTLGLTSIALP